MSDKRIVRFGDIVFDNPLDLRRIAQLIKEYGDEAPGEFWSEREGDWRPMVAIMADFQPYPDARLEQMREAGIKFVRVINSGEGNDCAACVALTKIKFSLKSPPSIPPKDCHCRPYCRCTIIAAE